MNIEQLRRQRGAIKAKLTSTENFITRVTDNLQDTTKEEIESRIQKLEEAYGKFQSITQQLSMAVPEEEYERRDAMEETEFDDRYFATRASLLQCLEKLEPSQTSTNRNGTTASESALTKVLEQQITLMQHLSERSNETSSSEVLARILEQQSQLMGRMSAGSGTSRESQIKLPIIKLPTFSGNIEEWKRYADTFKTLIHDNDIPSVQKHQYLVGSLSGPAAKVIESIEISEQNYAIAWELLRKRYEDEKAIRKRHVQCLFELPRVQRESACAMRELVDHVQKHLRILNSMNLPTESWGELIIFLIERNLDNATRRRWEEHAETLENLTTNDIIEFLQRRCQVLERASLIENSREVSSKSKFNSHDGNDNNKRNLSSQSRAQSKTSLSTSLQRGKCYLCQGQHLIYSCNEFLKLSIDNRIQTVKQLKLCINCLRNDHFVRDCKSSACRECGKRHNTLCHQPKDIASSTKSSRGRSVNVSTEFTGTPMDPEREMTIPSTEAASGSGVYHARGEQRRKSVIMSTAVVNARGNNGSGGQLRVLLDSASETNFITLAACKKLGLKLDNVCESINGLSNMSCTIEHGCQLRLKSRISDFELNLYCLVVPKITNNLPSFSIRGSQLPISGSLTLADPFYYNPGKVDALIGGEFFLQLLECGKIELGSDLPTLHNSKFGWILAGPIPERLVVKHPNSFLSVNAHACLLANESVSDSLLKFWELEEYPIDKHVTMSIEEQRCEEYFVNTTTRDSSGRFTVRLPFRENKNKLGNSRETAIKRLKYMERKFANNREFYDQYAEFMREYIRLNHMSRAIEKASFATPVYLPHHGVLRESSLTTKLRVVFDGSAKTASGISLNDTLMTGANLQDNIIDIILRFRLHAIAITADLKKMYRQVLIHDEDRDYQRILWRFSLNEPIQEFRLNTVTYGLACSPFLAIRCVKQLAKDESSRFNQASQVLLSDLYVDDILTGVSCKSEAIDLVVQLKSLLDSGGFEPHKWRSNCKEILTSVESCEQTTETSVAINNDNTINVKTLGLNWHPDKDIFKFAIHSISGTRKTKREVLSAISQLFDPLGLISPIIIRAKLIMQETWAANLGWDDPLTIELQEAWSAYAEDLKDSNAIEIPRRVTINNATQFYLHAFCDASLKAYGACVYLQTIDSDSNCNSTLLYSKSRVAPIKSKTITLPRLELCGAVILVRILKCVQEALKINFNKVIAWSDSTIALAWISGDPSRQKMFISNRTAEIQSILPSEHWYHVKSGDNPADLISRGTNIKELQRCKLWWRGPEWLSRYNERVLRETKLTNLSQEEIDIVKSEQRSKLQVFSISHNTNQTILFLLNNHSSLSKIERILARVFRFISSCRKTGANRKDNISIDEIHHANQLLILETQKIYFADEVSDLKAGRQIKSTSKLLSLSPFMDKTGLLRVGGRIQNSIATFNKKYPILLPSEGKFTKLLFEREHRRLLHVGPQALLYAIREKYWPIRGKNVARKISHECTICFKNNPKPLSQIMGQLPPDRVTPQRPFFVTGIDFAGPIVTLVNRGRGRKTNKSYISLFICFSTKAIHLEAVSDLSSSSFIAALRRFVGRRGCPQRVFCDNATNFVGARNELHETQKLIKERFKDINDEFCIPNNIDWKFIPPASPHMGGLWEAGVKSCKFHLKRVIGQNLLTLEELATILTQIEACLNSRPICQLPSTPTDLQPLTPGHFLIGEPLTALPEIDLVDVPINRLSRWQLVQKITQDFWRRWNREYLTSLQSKTKWKLKNANLVIDDVVLIQDNNLPPLKWKLGRVIETHAGADGKVRVVTLKIVNGNCKRAINKLCKLPMTEL